MPGRVIIVNNENFEYEVSYRGGSQRDVSRLEELFQSLNFEVCVFLDLPAQVIVQ